jgi:DNA polymerase III subunit epsilon
MIELAIVPVDDCGKAGNAWCTLLRPDRDLGPTDVHGIRGRDLRDAPAFDEILGEVRDRIAGRVIVAHNARFDCAFLEHELAQCEIDVAPLPALCTMEIAAQLGIGGSRSRLSDCCEALGLSNSGDHTAEADALACAALLAAYLRNGAEVAGLIRGDVLAVDSWPHSEKRAPCKKRDEISLAPAEPSFLARLVQTADTAVGTDMKQVAPYLDVLDRAVEDRLLNDSEQKELQAVAEMLELSAERIRTLHSDYVGTLVAVARRDGIITDRERHDLILVGEALGIGDVDTLLNQSSATPPEEIWDGEIQGQSVCFTGELVCKYEGQQVTREMAQALVEQAGMIVAPRVTKKLDMLVVADPNSMSGKARKAREYGVRIVAETAFWPMIGIEVS